MASKRFVGAMAILAFVLPVVAMATEFTVGDDQGWTIDFDYEAWAKDKVFHVGDKLVFKYTAGRHNVFKVNGTAFTNCTIPPANEALTTGNDVITLATPGRKWYICGVNDHCANYGQKLAITVLEAWVSPASAPSTPAASAPSTPAAPAPSTPAASAPSTPAAPAPSTPAAPAPSTPAAPAPSTPAAPAPSYAYGISVSGYQLLMAAMVAVAFLVI